MLRALESGRSTAATRSSPSALEVPPSDATPPAQDRGARHDLYALAAFGVAGFVHVSGVVGNAMYPLITSSAVVLALVGLIRYRPRIRWPWALLLVVGVLWTIAGIVRESTNATGDLSSGRSLAPDAFALPGYLLFGLAVYGFVRQRGPRRDVDALLDALLLTAGAGLIGYEVLIGPTLELADATAASRWAIVIYPAISIGLLVLAGRIAFDARARRRDFSFVVAGTSCLVLGDVVFALGEVGALSVPRHLLELPYLCVAAFFGCVALNPRIHQESAATGRDTAPSIGVDRLAALLFALFAPLVVVATGNDGEDLRVQAVLCGVLAVAAVTRLLRAIREQARLRAELIERATHDELTGMPSRSLVLDELSEQLRSGVESVCVLFLDLDDFKLVNDSMGHGAGDDLLVHVAERLRSVVRSTDLVGRISGDEFVVLSVNTNIVTAQALGDRMRRSLRQPFRLEQGEVFASASIGIAAHTAGNDNPFTPVPFLRKSEQGMTDRFRRHASQLMQQADTAMYRSKERGKNVTTVFDGSMTERVRQRLETESELRNALNLGQIDVVYQPIVHSASGRIDGFEALMRWNVDGRNVSPAYFIPVAEECGLIVPLGRHVLKEACRQVAWWRTNLPGAERLYVSVNLSPRQVLSSDIVDATEECLDEFGLDGDALWLELTENVMMEDTVTTSAVMAGLRSLGVRLAIDDFGTGYSSLSYLRRFPVSRVKIDRSFVTGLGVNESDSSLVAAIVAMADAIDVDIVAEGVETPQQAALLTDLGCDLLQGYLYSQGVPHDAVVKVMVDIDGTIRHGMVANRRCRSDLPG